MQSLPASLASKCSKFIILENFYLSSFSNEKGGSLPPVKRKNNFIVFNLSFQKYKLFCFLNFDIYNLLVF